MNVKRVESYSEEVFEYEILWLEYEILEHHLPCHSQKTTASSSSICFKAILRSIASSRAPVGQWQPEIFSWYLVRGYSAIFYSRRITSIHLLSPSHRFKEAGYIKPTPIPCQS